MAILVMCSNPKCGELFDAPDNSAGGKVRCPACGRVQPIAAKPTQPPATSSQPQEQPVEEIRLEELAASQPAKTPSSAPPTGKNDSLPQLDPLESADIDLLPDMPISAAPLPRARPADIKPQDEIQATSDEAGLTGVFDELYFPSSGKAPEIIEPPSPADDVVVLGTKSVAATVLILGMLGMAVGVFIGIWLNTSMPIVGVLIGAGVGWVAGFSLGVLLVFVIDKSEGERVRCSICGEVISATADVCRWCGSPAPTMGVSPLTGNSLAAWTYARGNMPCLIGLGALAMLVYLLASAAYHLPRLFPAQLEPWQPVLIGVAVVVGLFVLGYWMRYLRSVIVRTIRGAKEVPEAPPLKPLGDIAAAFHGLVVLTVYAGGMFALPLLPLGLLSMSVPGRRSALGLPWAVRTTWKLVGDYVILWLLILLWLAVMALGVVLVEFLFNLRTLLPTMEGYTRLIVQELLSAIKVLCTGVVVGMFLVAVFRCIGLFGRINAAALPAKLPDDKDRSL